ncbi:unnamed protein product [Pseudo-nitzschia multistriata]|uniref:Phosphodiesterase n=1 Tax=Pseudo-nitzschia multistriata TaxID=183589 RepID=A0A448ZRR4_9STRA|nr:unnamed protein product [Pseudo-nitzschia multistriata]
MEFGTLHETKDVIDHNGKSIEVNHVDVRDKSRWDVGLDCINSLLRPGSATLEAMTDYQRLGLKNLKAMIMLSGDMEDDTKNHIPQALLESSESASSDFLLAEYAGYDRRSQAKTLTNSIHKVLSAKKCAIKMKKIASSNVNARESAESLFLESVDFESKERTNLPPHWFDLDNTSKLKLRDLLSWENLSRWDFNVFEVDDTLKGKNTLIFVAWAIIGSPHSQYAMDMACSKIEGDTNTEVEGLAERKGYDFVSALKIREKTLLNFLREIENTYRDVIYHNKVHAADVTQNLNALFQMGGEFFSDGKLETFSMLIAAVVHDVGHPGVNNAFLIHSKSDLAIVYNDVSVLENMHLSTMFRIITGNSRDPKIDVFENFLEEETEVARKLIIKAVLSTDMTKHFKKLNTIRGVILSQEDGEEVTESLPMDICFTSEILSFMLHAADISNPSRDTATAIKWADKVLEESFHQGDLEQSMGLPITPLSDRNSTHREKSQIDFIKFIILPTFELLGQLIPRVTSEVIPKIFENLKYWQEQDLLRENEVRSRRRSKT